MLISEKFKDTNLFNLINNIEPLPFTGLVGLNNYWLNRYGERYIITNLENVDNETIALIIHDMYFERWVNLYNLYTEKALAGGNKTENTTRTKTDTGENNSTTKGENLHKVSAFDSDVMTDESSENENNTTIDNSKNETIETIITTGKNGNYINDFITYNKYLTETNFFDKICIDINNTISSGTITLCI